jgi:hypothetical protein
MLAGPAAAVAGITGQHPVAGITGQHPLAVFGAVRNVWPNAQFTPSERRPDSAADADHLAGPRAFWWA